MTSSNPTRHVLRVRRSRCPRVPRPRRCRSGSGCAAAATTRPPRQRRLQPPLNGRTACAVRSAPGRVSWLRAVANQFTDVSPSTSSRTAAEKSSGQGWAAADTLRARRLRRRLGHRPARRERAQGRGRRPGERLPARDRARDRARRDPRVDGHRLDDLRGRSGRRRLPGGGVHLEPAQSISSTTGLVTQRLEEVADPVDVDRDRTSSRGSPRSSATASSRTPRRTRSRSCSPSLRARSSRCSPTR